MSFFNHLPNHFLQWQAIFLSIIIEALPFILLGSILAGFIDVFVNSNKILNYLPKNKVLRIIFGALIGFVFPSCECGIVPIVTRLLRKKVPSDTAIPFLATAPIINPIVLFATYSAFGNSIRFVILRFLGAFLVAVVFGILFGLIIDEEILKTETKTPHHQQYDTIPLRQKLFLTLSHAIDEFFDTGRYLVLGSLVASAMQIYLPTRLLTTISTSPFLSILLLMLLAFILSLCSEADAFIGASLLSSFGLAPVMAFLLIGPMVDIKNLLMMAKVFKARFIGWFVGISSLVVMSYCLLLEVLG